ncbi:prepilin-type N-terminal cleavage/methylation domain-containing protein [Kordiimonas marina]|uniref:prepilin-type N-terminal cleavage/methylation domain-containing protein n=1 Tax=Kordiimonas marina TaxID=2872312 RepID=UPI001FF21332|nr:prepilin-type N-terminal cleavage/methylation domain-containing protein [Kordiimonas marina]MCJ9430039.1 prepilin-type N-terminal cleavage/methylation domain-containing protein [Kordiimonas marina]
MFQTKTNRSEAGYTLLELMVVLAIISMVVTAAPVIYERLIPSYRTRQFANDLADSLRAMRETARREGKVTQLSFDPKDGLLSSGSIQLNIPSGTSAEYVPDPTAQSAGSSSLMFFPTGASTGGTVKVQRNNLLVLVKVDWISGAVEVKQ